MLLHIKMMRGMFKVTEVKHQAHVYGVRVLQNNINICCVLSYIQ